MRRCRQVRVETGEDTTVIRLAFKLRQAGFHFPREVDIRKENFVRRSAIQDGVDTTEPADELVYVQVGEVVDDEALPPGAGRSDVGVVFEEGGVAESLGFLDVFDASDDAPDLREFFVLHFGWLPLFVWLVALF